MNNDAAVPLVLERAGGVARIRFNRPAALNAISVPMAEAFLDAVTRLAKDDSLRVVVLQGAGKGFMAGGDLPTLRADPVAGAQALIDPLHEATLRLADIDAPIVAQVHGVVAGAGLGLMLQADFVLAADDTRFNTAYIHLGTSCDVGLSWHLPRAVGLRRALELALLGDAFDAAQAAQWGLVNRLVAAATLAQEVDALVRRLAQGPTRAYGAMRRLMHASFDSPLASALAAEKLEFLRCAGTADFAEGVDAFLAKRKSVVFAGR